MTEAAGSSPPPRALAALLANLVAALAVGAAFASLAFVAGAQVPPPYGATASLRVLDLAPALLVIVAAGVAVPQSLRRWGWLVAAVGIAGAIGLFLQGTVLERDLLYGALAVVVGLQLGGVLLALAAASTSSRWAIVVGLGAGLTAGHYGLVQTVSELQRLQRTVLRGAAGHADEIALAALALVTLAAGILVAVQPHRAPSPDGSTGRGWRTPMIAIVVAAIVGRGLLIAWQVVLRAVAVSSTGGISQRRAETVETLDLIARILVAAVIATILLVVAYRRGGSGLARWVVVAFAIAAISPNLALLVDILVANLRRDIALPAVAAAVGAVLGGIAVRRLDRFFPWDALGVAVAALGVLLTSPRGRLELPDLAMPMSVLLALAVAFALTAGLARLPGGASAGGGERGLCAADVAMSAALGFSALVLCQQVFAPVTSLSVQQYGSLRLGQVVTMLIAAAVLVGLFGLARLVRRIRRDIVAEAAAGLAEPGPARVS